MAEALASIAQQQDPRAPRKEASPVVLGLALQPAPPGTGDVVGAARDLAVGTRLESGDLTPAAVPEGVLPPGTVADPAPLVGQLIGAAVSRGEAISAVRSSPGVCGPRAWPWSAARREKRLWRVKAGRRR